MHTGYEEIRMAGLTLLLADHSDGPFCFLRCVMHILVVTEDMFVMLWIAVESLSMPGYAHCYQSVL